MPLLFRRPGRLRKLSLRGHLLLKPQWRLSRLIPGWNSVLTLALLSRPGVLLRLYVQGRLLRYGLTLRPAVMARP